MCVLAHALSIHICKQSYLVNDPFASRASHPSAEKGCDRPLEVEVPTPMFHSSSRSETEEKLSIHVSRVVSLFSQLERLPESQEPAISPRHRCTLDSCMLLWRRQPLQQSSRWPREVVCIKLCDVAVEPNSHQAIAMF